MGILRGAIRTKLTTKAGLIAAGVVVIGGGAAIAAPGPSAPETLDPDPGIVEVLPVNDDLAAMAAHCEESPEDPFCQGDSYHGDNAEGFSAWVRSVPSDWGCIRGQLVSHAANQGPHGDHVDDLAFATPEEAATYLAEVRDDPDLLDRTCVTNVLGGSADAEDADEDESEEDGDAEGFSAWVRSVPSDWGCVRGQLVAEVARSDRADADLDALTFERAEEAAAYLAEQRDDPGYLDRRCVEVAIETDAGADAPDELDAEDAEPGADARKDRQGDVRGNAGGSGNGQGEGRSNGQGNGNAQGEGNGQGDGEGQGYGNRQGKGQGNGNR